MTHLDLIRWGEKPKYPICIPTLKRPDAHIFQFLKDAGISNAYIYVDDTDPHLEEYKKHGQIMVVGPSRNYVTKCYDIVEHQKSLGQEFIWKFDDDLTKLATKDMNGKYIDLDFNTFLATAEQFIDLEKDYYIKLQDGNIGLLLFGANNTYREHKLFYATSKRTIVAGGYGLNINLLHLKNINFDLNLPHGCGEDTDLVANFFSQGCTGKSIKFLERNFDYKVPSNCWGDRERRLQINKDVYHYLKKKYPDIIGWHPKGKNTVTNPKYKNEIPE